MKDLRKRREALGLSQQEMASRCGVAYNTYRMWEYGMQMKPENQKKLEEVLSHAETGRLS